MKGIYFEFSGVPTGREVWFVVSLMANMVNFKSANYKIFKNVSMTAYITNIQKSKFANI